MDNVLPVLLVVDDDKMLVTAIVRYLKGLADVHAVDTCKDAIAAAAERRDQIKAVLVDWNLAMETTEEAITKLRQLFGPEFPIYGWSGLREGLARQRALGCTDSFDKLDLAPLLSVLHGHFRPA